MNNMTTKLKKVAKEQSILIVDDDRVTLETIKSLISFFYKKVDSALNGAEALELYKNNKYDILLTDIIMPVMDGVELSKKVREINEKQVIIIASAHSESEHLLDLINIGVDQFLKKPINNNLIKVLYKESLKIDNSKLITQYKNDFKEEIAKRRTSILCSIKSLEFKKFLEQQDFDSDFVNIKEIYKFVEYEEPNLIILDDRVENVKFIINDLRSSNLTRHIPIAILSSKENKAHNKQLIVLGIEEIIPYELPNDEILKIIVRIITRERYSNSYSGRFIRGLQGYEDSRIHGIKLRTIAKVICREYMLNTSDTMDIKSVLSLLSTTIGNNKRVSSLINFFKKMRFSRRIRELLEEVESPSDLTSEIIKAIYYVYRSKCKTRECHIIGVRDEITQLAYKCMDENTVIIERPTDLDFLYVTLTDILTIHKEVDLFKGHDLINIVSSIAHNFLLNKKSILIHTIVNNEHNIEVSIDTYDDVDFNEYLEDVLIPDNLTQEQQDKKLTITTQTKIETPEEINQSIIEEDMFIDIESSIESSEEEEKESISAVNFIERLEKEDIDFDILDELSELEDDLDGIASKDLITMDIVESVSNIVIRYARFIESIMEFHNISSSLYSLSTILGRVKEENLTRLDKSLLAFFEGILYDIKNWREGIFVYKTVEDIHFLDASFISNCSQIEMFLAPPEEKKDLSSDDILFF